MSKADSEELMEESRLSVQFHPWHSHQKKMLMELMHSGRLHHAFLLFGPKGIGKFDFACAAAATMLCENPSENNACGLCRACVMFQAYTHPDFFLLQPAEEGKQIVIDEIRTLTSFMSKSASRRGKRVVIIDDCDQLNNAASNALLKFLEEPGDDVHLFLVCQQIENLLPTINSRCQKLAFSSIDKDRVAEWLTNQGVDPAVMSDALFEFANGSPVDALELVDSRIFIEREKILSSLSKSLSGELSMFAAFRSLEAYDLIILMKVWHSWCLDVLRIQSGVDAHHLRFQTMLIALEQVASMLKENDLPAFMDRLLLECNQLQKGSTVNQSLLLQDLLVAWSGLK